MTNFQKGTGDWTQFRQWPELDEINLHFSESGPRRIEYSEAMDKISELCLKGALLWEVKLPGNGLATPSIYQLDGRQYVTIAVSIGESLTRLSHTKSGIVTFALPNE